MSMTYTLIDDTKKNTYVQTFYKEDKEKFKKLNSKGWGVYFAVNEFEATEDEMKSHGVKTKRNIRFLKKLRFVFADLDIAKAGNSISREEKEKRKNKLINALGAKCNPTMIIDTSNGIQPLWKLNKCSVDDNTQDRYVDIINGIIEWSKSNGAMGDQVKDVTRVLRMPGYYHMKEEPYECKIIGDYDKNNERTYDLDELERIFPFVGKNIKESGSQTSDKINSISYGTGNSNISSNFELNPISQAIEQIDFKELVIKAFGSNGRLADFDDKNRLILDGRLTGTFIGKKGNQDYLASTSHEPFTGNRITAIAGILSVTNKEAREWIIKEYRLSMQEAEASKIAEGILGELENEHKGENNDKDNEGTNETSKSLIIAPIKCNQSNQMVEDAEVVDESSYSNDNLNNNNNYNNNDTSYGEYNKESPKYSWGTRMADEKLAMISRTSYVIINGETGAGKTTYAFNIALLNAIIGYKVLFINLEMSKEQIFNDICKKYAGYTIKDERYGIPQDKRDLYDRRMHELNSVKNLYILGLRRGGNDYTWELIREIINKKLKQLNGDLDMIFIDNLDLIEGYKGESEESRVRGISKKIMKFTEEMKIPVILLHHFRKANTQAKSGGTRALDEMRGSGKLGHDADLVLQVVRNIKNAEKDEEKIRTTLVIQKARGYQCDVHSIYFYKGQYMDLEDYRRFSGNGRSKVVNYYDVDNE